MTGPDTDTQTEQALFAALLAWAADARRRGVAPTALTEGKFQRELAVHLETRFDRVRLERTLRAVAGADPVLARWPLVGPLDLELEVSEAANTWVELKWAKTTDALATARGTRPSSSKRCAPALPIVDTSSQALRWRCGGRRGMRSGSSVPRCSTGTRS